jgi:hypothetical protein
MRAIRLAGTQEREILDVSTAASCSRATRARSGRHLHVARELRRRNDVSTHTDAHRYQSALGCKALFSSLGLGGCEGVSGRLRVPASGAVQHTAVVLVTGSRCSNHYFHRRSSSRMLLHRRSRNHLLQKVQRQCQGSRTRPRSRRWEARTRRAARSRRSHRPMQQKCHRRRRRTQLPGRCHRHRSFIRHGCIALAMSIVHRGFIVSDSTDQPSLTTDSLELGGVDPVSAESAC